MLREEGREHRRGSAKGISDALPLRVNSLRPLDDLESRRIIGVDVVGNDWTGVSIEDAVKPNPRREPGQFELVPRREINGRRD